MSALCSEGMLCGVHSFVHNFVRSGSGVEFAVRFVLKSFVRSGSGVEFVLKGFDLASRIKSDTPGWIKKPPF